MTTSVVNLREFGFPRGKLPDDVVRIDRRSEWGNPWRIGQPFCADCPPDRRDGRPMTRADVIERYRSTIEVILAGNPTFLEPLRGKRLACWCAPLACHGDVIVELLG